MGKKLKQAKRKVKTSLKVSAKRNKLKSTRFKKPTVLLLLLAIGITGYLFFWNTYSSGVLRTNKAAHIKSESQATAFLTNLPNPLHASWGIIKQDSYSYVSEMYERNISGYSRTFTKEVTSNDIKRMEIEFSKFATPLTKGWQEDEYNGDYDSDTKNTTTYAYKKIDGDNQVLLLIKLDYRLTNVEDTNDTSSCPCAYTYKVFYSNPFSVDYTPPSATPTPTLEVFDGPLSAIPSSFKTTQFSKRQFDLAGKFFDKYGYPTDVKDIPASQLVGMKCSYNVNADGAGQGFTLSDYNGLNVTQNITSNDSFYQALHNKIALAKGEPGGFSYCITEDGVELITYGHAKFAILRSRDNSIDETASIEAPYTTCGYPIELTTQGNIYYICSGGDSIAHAYIYQLNIHNRTIKVIFSCSTDLPGVSPGPPQCTNNQNH